MSEIRETTVPTIETFAEWYGNGDTGEDLVSDGMGNGACLYRLENGELWYFEWTDQGFDYCGKLDSREEWDRFVENYPTGRGRVTMSDVEQTAKDAGVFVDSYSPGNGYTRYRFFSVPADYFGGGDRETLYTALGRKDALTWLAGYATGRNGR